MLHDRHFDAIISLKAFHHIPDPLSCIRILVDATLCMFPIEILSEAERTSHHRRSVVGRVLLWYSLNRSHSPQYHRSISEPPCCHGFTCDELSSMLTDAGLKANVGRVDVVHYLTCLDQQAAKSHFESLHLPPCDILATEESRLPPMIRLNDCYYERDVFPFVVACGSVSPVSNKHNNRYNPLIQIRPLWTIPATAAVGSSAPWPSP